MQLTKYIPLALVALIPVLLSAGLYLAFNRTPLADWSERRKQIFVGICFGLVAIFGTEFGVPMDGLRVNARDAAPVCAGLIFGAPAGIMAGLIGGIERYLAAYWGAGFFTQVACTLGTIFAGLLAAWLRKFMFDDKKPGWIYGLIIGAVAEITHMMFIFFTNMDDARLGFHFIHLCTIPMVTANALSVMMALMAVGMLGKESQTRRSEVPNLAETFQKWLLGCLVVAFSCAFAFTYVLQSNIYQRTTTEIFRKNLEDAKLDVDTLADRKSTMGLAVSDKADTSAEAVTFLDSITKTWHVGDNGYLLVFDSRGTLINKGREGVTSENTIVDWESLREGDLSKAWIGGSEAYVMPLITDKYRLLAVVSEEQADFSRNLSIYLMTFITVLIFFVLFVLIYCLIRRQIVEKIQRVNDSLACITAGQLDEVVDVRDSAEFTSLSDDINSTVDTLKRYIEEAAARIDQELEFARQIQYSSLPSIFPPYPQHREFDIFASMDTAKEVGGDFYDFYFVGADKFAFLVADVSGKGIPAAMFMMRARAIIKGVSETGAPVDEIFTEANNALCQGNEQNMFVTVWMGILDVNTGEVEFGNAGHNPPLLLQSNGSGEWLKKRTGIAMGNKENVSYKAPQRMKLMPGDTIYLYTDGVTECNNTKAAFYGEKRLLQVIEANTNLSPVEICAKVKEDVVAFADGAPQFDDITMMAVRYNGQL